MKARRAVAADPVAVILCGGLGERFWPATGPGLPKYALKFNQDQTFLSATYGRLLRVYPEDRVYVITAVEHRRLVKKLLPRMKPSRILAEPMRRNTAGAIAYAMLALKRSGAAAGPVSFFPADAMIKDERGFALLLKEKIDYVKSTGGIAVIGVKPTYPATGYGYVRRGDPLGAAWKRGFRVENFTEKPPLEEAKRFLKQGTCWWNAGIFTWTAAAFEKAMRKHAAAYYGALEKAFDKGPAAVRRSFEALPSAPIDKLLMEKLDGLAVFRGDFDWDDIGSWDALRRIDADSNGNTILSDGVYEDVRDSVVDCDPGTRVALSGLRNVAVVQKGPYLLVCSLDHAQRVSRLRREVLARPAPGRRKRS